MAVWRQVLVELADVESINGADDVGTEFGNVHVTEVKVLTVGGKNRTAAAAHLVGAMFTPCEQLGFRGSGRCWRSMRLTWENRQREDLCV